MKSSAEFEAYLNAQSDYEIKVMFEMGYAKILMPLELDDCLHKRILQVGIQYDPAFIRYLPKVDDAELFLQIMMERLGSHNRVLECMNRYLPKRIWTAELINFMKADVFIFSLKGCQDHLFTFDNISWVLHETDLKVSDIPAQMITQDIAHLMYTETDCHLRELPFEFRTYELARKIKRIEHLRKVPDVFLPELAKEWLTGCGSFTVPVDAPLNAQDASQTYNQLLMDHYYDDDPIMLQVLRLYKQVFLSFDKLELWQYRQTMTERILLEHYGRELMETEGFPAKLKRTYIESDLSL